MKLQSTRFLLVVALVLLGYIVVFERDRPASSGPAQPVELIAGFDPTRADRIDFIFPTNQVLQLEREGNAWRIVLPTPYPVRSEAVDQFLAAVQALRKRITISAAEQAGQARGLAAYGLDNPSAVVQIRHDGRTSELRIGSPAPMGDLFYLQTIGSADVIAADATFLRRIPGGIHDWRSRILVDLRSLAFDRIEARAGTLGYELERNPTNRLWLLSKPLALPANSPKVDGLLEVLQRIEVQEFVPTLTPVDLERHGLQAPRLEWAVSRGTNELFSIRFGLSPTNQPGLVYARLSRHSNVVLVAREALDLLNLPYSEFMDPQLLRFQTGAVDRVEVRLPADAYQLVRQTNGTWQAHPGGFQADPGLMKEFFEMLHRLEIVEIEKDVVTELDFPRYGFSTNSPHIQLSTTTTNAAGQVTNSVIARATFGSNHLDRILVRRNSDSPVFVTRFGDFRQVPRGSFEFRDRILDLIPTNQVTAFSLAYKGEIRKWVRTPDGSWAWATPGNGAIPLALEEAVHRLAQLEADSWVAVGDVHLPRFGFSEGAHQVTLEGTRDGKPVKTTIDFGARASTLAPYAAIIPAGETRKHVCRIRFWYYDAYNNLLKELNLGETGGR